MRLTVIAVGTRMPPWADQAFEDYVRRMPRTAVIELVEVRPEARTGRPVATLLAAEAARIRAAVPKGAIVVLLDERGCELTTRGLAARLGGWLESGRPVALILGGPDGVDPALKSAAAETVKLSSLTLPHALARVLLAEALYRAWTMLNNHPYHRE